MTKEEIAELIDQMPQGMDVNDYIHELVNRALAVEREWVGLTDHELQVLDFNDPERGKLARAVEAKLRERNTHD